MWCTALAYRVICCGHSCTTCSVPLANVLRLRLFPQSLITVCFRFYIFFLLVLVVCTYPFFLCGLFHAARQRGQQSPSNIVFVNTCAPSAFSKLYILFPPFPTPAVLVAKLSVLGPCQSLPCARPLVACPPTTAMCLMVSRCSLLWFLFEHHPHVTLSAKFR